MSELSIVLIFFILFQLGMNIIFVYQWQKWRYKYDKLLYDKFVENIAKSSGLPITVFHGEKVGKVILDDEFEGDKSDE